VENPVYAPHGFFHFVVITKLADKIFYIGPLWPKPIGIAIKNPDLVTFGPQKVD
jgi:hypothetical protein